jgi:hypothetical protein
VNSTIDHRKRPKVVERITVLAFRTAVVTICRADVTSSSSEVTIGRNKRSQHEHQHRSRGSSARTLSMSATLSA